MTTQRWNRICDRWLTIVLIPLLVTAIHYEVGYWPGTLLVILFIVCGGISGAFIIGAIIACSEGILDWLKGY
jgi:hypothetical protein